MRRFRMAARGIPHMLTAGVYTALDDYVDGLERFREQVGRTANTADGIFVFHTLASRSRSRRWPRNSRTRHRRAVCAPNT